MPSNAVPNNKHSSAPLASGQFAFAGLDRVIHEKARLGLMTSLVARPEGLAFNDLKELCELTDGNLNRHLDVLHEAGLVDIRKVKEGRRTRTVCRVTPLGRRRFLEYVGELERVVAEAAQAAQAAQSTAPAGRITAQPADRNNARKLATT